MKEDFTTGLLVKKDGLYQREWEEGKQLEFKVDSFIPFLNYIIKVEDDITFEDFFNLIIKEYEIMSVVFFSHMGGFDLEDWLEEWNKPFIDTNDGHTKTKHLEVGWSVEWWDKKIGRHIEEWVNFRGVGKTLNEETQEWENDMYISFSFTPLNEMKKYPFKISTEYNVFDWEKYKEDKNKKIQNEYFTIKSRKEMTTYDVIGAILNEITFYGDPSQRNEFAFELSETSNELKEMIDKEGIDNTIKNKKLLDYLFEEDEEDEEE